jgi:hypothetical protein
MSGVAQVRDARFTANQGAPGPASGTWDRISLFALALPIISINWRTMKSRDAQQENSGTVMSGMNPVRTTRNKKNTPN